ncbi:MFS transporter [Jeotgalibaca sp. MA1X17-3]|uniref:MFS transporter n=1 Tax=Jeotgalibaca sp. MA1X17-3 TaxID=2908211 RepID=UPI001F488EDD|nr:MFS transporter [Jeotgalibaca sp. MA1X17-3]UJF15276.1 MFS transporter [Jeotgalibaca sp. MA1X17-3]
MKKKKVNDMDHSVNSSSSNRAQLNRAKIWQIAFFAANNLATNCYAVLMIYVSYFANGVAGFAISTVAILLTSLRIFDGITDPIVGALIDRTNGKLGKFRPFMIVGNLILMASISSLFYITPTITNGTTRLLFFIIIYMIYVVGYTLQTAVTKAGQSVLTSDPKQRPLFALFDTLMVLAVFGLVPVYVSTVLAKKYGGLGTIELFHDMVPKVIIFSAICTVIAVIGIWSKDRKEFFGTGVNPKVKMKDYLDVIKKNRALQMLIIAATSDKLALGVATNATVGIMLYGIFFGDYALAGLLSLAGLVGGVLITIVGVTIARKIDQKRAYVTFTKLALTCYSIIAVLLLFSNPGDISFTNFGLPTILFLIFYIVGYGSYMVAGNLSIPMIADCTDYETYLSGRYIPGMIGTLFSFVDKLLNSLSSSIVGFSVILIGFKILPDLDTPFTNSIKYLAIFLFCGLPILAWITSIIAMKHYPLDQEMMEKVQIKILETKKQALAEEEL